MGGYRADLTFSMKILAKPRQMEMLEEQFKMLSSKAESVSNDFTRIKDLVKLIVDPRHIEGLEGAKSQKNIEDIHEEEVLGEIQSIKIADNIQSLIKELRVMTSKV